MAIHLYYRYGIVVVGLLLLLQLFAISSDAFVLTTSTSQRQRQHQRQRQQRHPIHLLHSKPPSSSSSSSSFPVPENEASSFNDAFLNSLENDGKKSASSANSVSSSKDNTSSSSVSNSGTSSIDPSPDSLAALRDLATSNVANFLATFSQPPTGEADAEADAEKKNDMNIDVSKLEEIHSDMMSSTNGNTKTKTKAKNNNTNKEKEKEGVSSTSSNASILESTLQSSNDITQPTKLKPKQEPQPQPINIHWDVYVCQSKQCIERGASATLDSFQALVPNNPQSSSSVLVSSLSPSIISNQQQQSTITTITIHPAILSKSKTKGGPNIRCIQRITDSTSDSDSDSSPSSSSSPYKSKSFEVNNVNDIDKVYRILTKHMSITNISKHAKDCLKYTYLGNSQLEKNELTNAIQSYNLALEQKQYESDYISSLLSSSSSSLSSLDGEDVNDNDSDSDNDSGGTISNESITSQIQDDQEGMLLLLRATAYLKRAFQHQEVLRQTVTDLGLTVSDPKLLGKLYSIAEDNPTLAKGIFQKVLIDSKAQDKKFRLTKYRHGLYEYSLLHAAQDSLRSTQLLPYHAKTWLRAGDALAELRKLKESALYYEKAIELDPTLRSRLEPVIERLNRSQEFLDKARGWWSSDTLRLALDVAG